MSDKDELDDLSQQIEQSVADGERLCAELKAQLQNAKAIVREAKAKLAEVSDEPRSFQRTERRPRH